jgi:hypothetical protein
MVSCKVFVRRFQPSLRNQVNHRVFPFHREIAQEEHLKKILNNKTVLISHNTLLANMIVPV